MTSPDEGPDVERLPGIGSSLRLTDEDGQPLQAVRLQDGTVELFVRPTDGSVSLAASTARSLGAFVSGHYAMAPDVSERIDDVLGGLVFDWIELPAGAHAVGRSIGQLRVRQRTGVTIVAVLRGPSPIVAPDPDLVLGAHDGLVVACGEQDLDDVERYLVRGD